MNFAPKYRIIFKFDDSFTNVSFVEGMGVSGYKDLDFVAVYENRNFEAFLPEKEIAKASKIGFDFCLHREKSKKLHREIKQLLEQIRSFWGELDEIDFSKLSNKKFKDLFIRYVELDIELWSHFSLTEFYYFNQVEDTISEAINSNEDRITLLTSTKLANILTEEYLKRLELALKIKEDSVKEDFYIEEHLKNYNYIHYSTGGPKWTKSSFKSEIKNLLRKSIENLNSARNRILESDKLLQNQQEQLLVRLKLSPKILVLIESVKSWQEIKWMMRIFLNRTFVSRNCLDIRFIREMVRRTKYTYVQIANMYYEETLEILDGKKIDKKEIDQRIGLYAAFNQSGKITFIYGDKVREFARKIRERTYGYHQKVTELKGRVASSGFAVGRARVFGGGAVATFKDQLNKMKKGEILVAESTSPEYMPAIRKAAAIVADEGGITSHAAIISRELKIPCVVGTHYAIRNIKTGDLVEVDANLGIVKILKS